MNVSAIIKRKNKWLVGFITSDIKFKKKSEIRKLAEIKKQSNYITLKSYLKSKGDIKEDTIKKILKKLRASSCYILDKPFQLTDNEWEKWWWNDYNKLCLSCRYKCKQSHRTQVYNCRLLMEKR